MNMEMLPFQAMARIVEPFPHDGRRRSTFHLIDLVRSLGRIPDRSDTPPDPPTLLQGVTPAFTAPEIYDDFDLYIKLFREIFGSK